MYRVINRIALLYKTTVLPDAASAPSEFFFLGEQTSKCFCLLKGLPEAIGSEHLQRAFQGFGKIDKAHVYHIFDEAIGYITFLEAIAAAGAKEAIHGRTVDCGRFKVATGFFFRHCSHSSKAAFILETRMCYFMWILMYWVD